MYSVPKILSLVFKVLDGKLLSIADLPIRLIILRQTAAPCVRLLSGLIQSYNSEMGDVLSYIYLYLYKFHK